MFQLKDVSLCGLKQVSYVSLTYKVAFACFKGESLELYVIKFTNLIKILNFGCGNSKLTFNRIEMANKWFGYGIAKNRLTKF